MRVAFSDWTDRNNLVWLKRSADGYRFYGLRADAEGRMVSDPDNCSSCWSSNELKYVGADGRDKIATIEMYAAPQGQPSFSTEVLEVGDPVAFDAGGFKPANAVGPLTYQWQFQRDDCGVLPCTTLSGPNFDVVPVYGPPVTGATASHTWQLGDTMHAKLTASDTQGHQATKDMTVVIKKIPPRVTLARDCAVVPVPVGCNTTRPRSARRPSCSAASVSAVRPTRRRSSSTGVTAPRPAGKSATTR